MTITLTNVAPNASAQTVSAPVNVDKAITLAATDANLDTLTYAVTVQPTKGTGAARLRVRAPTTRTLG